MSKWVVVQGGQGSPGDPRGAIHDVRAYGAKGDGTSDDSAAFLEAIDAAGGALVYIPHGDYVVSLDIADQPVRMSGPGRLIQPRGRDAITVRRTLGPARTVTVVSTLAVGSASGGSPTAEKATRIDVDGSVDGLAQGDVLHLSSGDYYEWSRAGQYTYQASLVKVHGIGLAYTGETNGGFTDGALVVGAASGAQAISRLTPATASDVLLFSSVDGDFQDGENLLVNGTARGVANGAPFLVMAGRLADTFTTNPVIRKMATAPLELNGITIVASANPDAPANADERGIAIQLIGVVGARVTGRIQSAWGRGIQLAGCYGADIDVRVDRLPNNAQPAESAYGYGVEVWGATEYSRIRVQATNVRHAFTTNTGHNSAHQYADPLMTGTAKYNLVHDSTAVNTVSAGFDTHIGAYFTEFTDCHVVNTFAGGRHLTATAGFQNRAFGTVYRDCTATNVLTGFLDTAANEPAPFGNVNRYIDCAAVNYERAGFWLADNPADTLTRVEMVDCDAVGDGSATNDPYYQAGYALGSIPVTLHNCRSRRFNGTPFALPGGTNSRVTAIDCVGDYRDSAGFTTGLRIDGTVAELSLIGYKVILDPSAPAVPAGAVRNAAGDNTLNTDGSLTIGGTARPLTQVTGGNLTVNVLTKTIA